MRQAALSLSQPTSAHFGQLFGAPLLSAKMRCCLIHESLNTSNKIVKVYLVEFLFLTASSHVLEKQSRKFPILVCWVKNCINYLNKPQHLGLLWVLNDSLWYELLPYSGYSALIFTALYFSNFPTLQSVICHRIIKDLVDFLTVRLGRLISNLFLVTLPTKKACAIHLRNQSFKNIYWSHLCTRIPLIKWDKEVKVHILACKDVTTQLVQTIKKTIVI